MKLITLTLLTVFTVSLAATAQQEELKSAAANLEKKDYIAALDNINSAKTKVAVMMAEQLTAVLPQKFGEFEMQANEGGMEGQGMSIYKIYRRPLSSGNQQSAEVQTETVGEDGMPDPGAATDPASMDPMMAQQSQISVQITTDMMMASELQMAHSGTDNGMMMQEGGNKAIRIKGYRAMTRSDSFAMPGMEGGGSEEAQAIVGGAFISVTAQGLKEKGQAEKFLSLIDFDKLKGIVGE